MPLIFTIAWRNIFRHRGKSLVIGAILFLGAFLMTVGSGIITGLDRGLQDNIVNSFTGDLLVISNKQINNAVLTPMSGAASEPINNFIQFRSLLKNHKMIDHYVPAAQGTPMVMSDEGDPDFNFIIGVDFKQYRAMFPHKFRVLEGRQPKDDERGLLLTEFNRRMNYEYLLNYWVIPAGTKLVTANLSKEALTAYKKGTLRIKDKMVFMGMNDKTSAMDIMPPVLGIIKFKALDTFIGISNLVDIETYRECFGYTTAAESHVTLNKEQANLLTNTDLSDDDLFSNKSMFGSAGSSVADYSIHSVKKETARTLVVTENILDVDEGMYNMVFIKLKSGIPLVKAVSVLNQDLKPYGVRVITWKQALGEIAELATIIKASLFIFVMFIFFVAIIIIMNTLSMAALERVSEIGMMRAVGARKGFISKMFFSETAFLSFFFGGLGILFGLITITILSWIGLSTDNDMLQLVYGGERFHPFLTMGDLAACLVQLSIVTAVSTLYPMRVARQITPLHAIAKD